RVLRKSSAFTAVAVLTLAVGIGGITAIFSVVNGVILRPLPYPNAGRLVSLLEVRNESSGGRPYVAPPQGADWTDRPETKALLESLTWLRVTEWARPEDAAAPIVTGAEVPANYFSVVGATPILGRDFMPQDANQIGSI